MATVRHLRSILRYFSFALVILLILPSVPYLPTTASAQTDIPNILEYKDNASSTEFVISSGYGMAEFSKLSSSTDFKGKTVYLACDIDMTNIPYTPFTKFAGTFDGCGHAIKELKITTSGISSGVFSTTTATAIIKNLGIVGGTITASCATDSQRVGSIVGVMSGGLIEKCYSTAAITGKQVSSTDTTDISVGGIAGGALNNAVIKNCYFAGYAKGVDHASGITDWGQGQTAGKIASLINCYNMGELVATKCYGIARFSNSTVSSNYDAAMKNCYYLNTYDTYSWSSGATASSRSAFGGGTVAYKLDNGDSSSRTRDWHQGELFPELSYGDGGTYRLTLEFTANGVKSSSTVYANAGYKHAIALPGTVTVSVTSSQATVSDNIITVPAANAKASVTVSAPNILDYDSNKNASVYVITSGSGFTKLASIVNAGTDTFAGKSLYMLCDINMFSISNHTPIGTYISDSDWSKAFKGKLYGNGFKVFSLTVNKASSNGVGLFGASYGATFDSIGVFGNVTGLNRAGGLTGYGDKCTFNRCYNFANVTTKGGTDGAGGIAGVARSSSKFYYCFNGGTVKAEGDAAGGIAGWGQTNVTLESCYNFGKVTAPSSYTAFVRTGDGYSNELVGCNYLSAASKSLNGGVSRARSKFATGYAAWHLNTAGGTKSNSGVFTSTPLYPALATINSTPTARVKVTYVDPAGNSRGSKYLYANVGRACAPEDIYGCYTESGVTVAKLDYSTNVNAKALTEKITYVLNGGTLANADKYSTYNIGTVTVLPDETAVTRSGYMFGGWYTNSSFTSKVYATLEAEATGKKTFYAKWCETVSIRTPAEFVSFVSAVNGGNDYALKYVSLESDLDLSSVTVAPIGTEANAFRGVFNGNGFRITALNMKTSATHSGLFGYIDGATIKNFALENSVINGGKYSGTLVGTNNGGAIVNCGSDSTVTAGSSASDAKLKIMSFNIRYGGADASPNDVATRGERVKKYLQSYSPDIVGFQEVNTPWTSKLNSYMTGYSKEFKYRASSSQEATPIYWKTSRFNCLEQGTFWLSETPNVESKGWDAGYYRICSFAILLDKNTNKLVIFYNTHLDVDGAKARLEGAKLVISRMEASRDKYEAKGYTDIAMFCTGDYNCKENSDPYKEYAKAFNDAKYYATDLQTPLTTPTYNGFTGSSKNIIDFIFTDASTVNIQTYKVTTEKINGYFVSDHYGLYATVSYERRNAGGIVGVNKGTVINTYFKGSASSGVSVGGIAGTNLGSIITSYAAPASLSTAATRGGTVGLNRGVSTNVYYLTASDYTGTGINKGTGAGTAKAESAIKSASFLTLLNAFGTAWGYSAERNGGYPYPLALGELKTIVLSSGAKCRCNADDIYNVAEGIALERFLGFFVNEKLTFTNADNVTVTDGTETVTTGYTVTLVDGNGATLDSRTVIVAGDIDCDGKITNNDYTAVKAHFKLLVSLNSIQLKAADTDSSSKLTTTDYIRIKRHTMGTYILGER